jgi:hypothetical protein
MIPTSRENLLEKLSETKIHQIKKIIFLKINLPLKNHPLHKNKSMLNHLENNLK